MIKFLSISQNTGSKILQKLEENCELRGTDNVQGQISELFFAPNAGYCGYYLSNIFLNKIIGGIFSDISQFELGSNWSSDMF